MSTNQESSEAEAHYVGYIFCYVSFFLKPNDLKPCAALCSLNYIQKLITFLRVLISLTTPDNDPRSADSFTG